jgi:hypothetical protein
VASCVRSVYTPGEEPQPIPQLTIPTCTVYFKGIVSLDFVVYFFMSFDRSEVPTHKAQELLSIDLSNGAKSICANLVRLPFKKFTFSIMTRVSAHAAKGIVSRDFVVCFLVTFDRSEVPTHKGQQLKIYRMVPKNICANLVRISLLNVYIFNHDACFSTCCLSSVAIRDVYSGPDPAFQNRQNPDLTVDTIYSKSFVLPLYSVRSIKSPGKMSSIAKNY